MPLTIGLDIGGSTTKIVAMENRKVLSCQLVHADDPLTSAYGALGRLLFERKGKLSDIESVAVTGVGSKFMGERLFDLPLCPVDEFSALGAGGLYLAKVDHSVVVSIGTGTAFVEAKKELEAVKTSHLFGTGVGGGTLLGLSQVLLKTRDFLLIDSLAQAGDPNKVDLSIFDLTGSDLPGLPKDTTASNFGKMQEPLNDEDLAAGIINLVYQTIGIMAKQAADSLNLSRVVFTGNGSRNLAGCNVLNFVSKLYGLDFIVPESAEFATAVGAALLATKNKD